MTQRSLIDGRLLLSFEGHELPGDVQKTFAERDVSGVTLFRPHNYDTPAQLWELNASIQRANRSDVPALIAIDQEGGQLHAFGSPATMWPGNMALGAVNDTVLTERVGAAIAAELRAVGINVVYAPVADLASNPNNPATGARSFGDDPAHVAGHVGAIVRGFQSQGVAATMKHFPGKGNASVDSHHAMPLLGHDLNRLHDVELAPFKAAIAADVKLVMTGHFALPALTGSDDLPCTLAAESNTHLLRDELGFAGAMVTDALDMKALEQGAYQIVDLIAAVGSGVDLLLLTADEAQQERATIGLELAVSRRLIAEERLQEAEQRVRSLRSWVAFDSAPNLDVVGSRDHSELNREVSERSITLLKNDDGLLPLGLTNSSSVLVVETQPAKITPADTSDYEEPLLADELRSVSNAQISSLVVPFEPDGQDIAAAIAQAVSVDVVVIGTAAASLVPSQSELVRAVHSANHRTIVLAQRTPWDILEFPEIQTYLCSWSVNRESTRAAAQALTGAMPITGRCPVAVGAFPSGAGIDLR
ncbi:MAG: glycoside hydrolase family 3 protein [Acidimicrobiia bacterium]